MRNPTSVRGKAALGNLPDLTNWRGTTANTPDLNPSSAICAKDNSPEVIICRFIWRDTKFFQFFIKFIQSLNCDLLKLKIYSLLRSNLDSCHSLFFRSGNTPIFSLFFLDQSFMTWHSIRKFPIYILGHLIMKLRYTHKTAGGLLHLRGQKY